MTATTPDHDVLRWLSERQLNCLRIADGKTGADRAGWLEDAAYFGRAITVLSAQRRMPSREEIARVIVAPERPDALRLQYWERVLTETERCAALKGADAIIALIYTCLNMDSKLADQRQAGEIEVTREMIECGIGAYWDGGGQAGIDADVPQLVIAIFRAMRALEEERTSP